MFSENNKISGRQIFRLLSYDLIGLGTLLLPPVLAKTAGTDGIFCIIAGTILALCYLGLLWVAVKRMKVDFRTFLKERGGVVLEKVILVFYVFYFLLFAAVAAYVFADLVLSQLLEDGSFYLVLALLLLLAGYGVRIGIEGRARIYEILFWIVLIPLLVMLLGAGREVDVNLWTPVAVTSFGNFCRGSLVVFLAESLIFLVVFFFSYAAREKDVICNARRALILAGGLIFFVYLILLGVFGSSALAGMEYPAVTLMSIVQITGGFLKRTDALMFGIWFFTLYALLNGLVFYGVKTAKDVVRRGKEGVYLTIVIVLIFLLAVLCYQSEAWREGMSRILWTVATPVAVLIPLLAGFLPKGRTKTLALFLAAGAAGILSGCNTVELEDRSFPLAVAIEKREDIESLWLNQEEAKNKEIDYNHLKVMILSEELIEEEEQMEDLLGVLAANPKIPRNTYIMVAEKPGEILSLQESIGEEESVGDYLEKLLEGNASMKEGAFPTLGKLYQERENHLETLFLPYLAAQDDMPFIEKYYVWKRGEAAGTAEIPAAMLSALFQGNLEKETFVLENGNSIRISSFLVNEQFVEEDGERYLALEVSCEGETIYEKENWGEQKKKLYEQAIEEYYQKVADDMMERNVDISNSYKRIGGYRREWYSYYKEHPAAFEEELALEVDVELKLVH